MGSLRWPGGRGCFPLDSTLSTGATVLAEVFPPAGAVEAGFLDRVAGAAEFDQELAAVLAGIAQLDMTAHAATKLRVRKQALAAIHEAIQLESASYAA